MDNQVTNKEHERGASKCAHYSRLLDRMTIYSVKETNAMSSPFVKACINSEEYCKILIPIKKWVAC